MAYQHIDRETHKKLIIMFKSLKDQPENNPYLGNAENAGKLIGKWLGDISNEFISGYHTKASEKQIARDRAILVGLGDYAFSELVCGETDRSLLGAKTLLNQQRIASAYVPDSSKKIMQKSKLLIDAGIALNTQESLALAAQSVNEAFANLKPKGEDRKALHLKGHEAIEALLIKNKEKPVNIQMSDLVVERSNYCEFSMPEDHAAAETLVQDMDQIVDVVLTGVALSRHDNAVERAGRVVNRSFNKMFYGRQLLAPVKEKIIAAGMYFNNPDSLATAYQVALGKYPYCQGDKKQEKRALKQGAAAIDGLVAINTNESLVSAISAIKGTNENLSGLIAYTVADISVSNLGKVFDACVPSDDMDRVDLANKVIGTCFKISVTPQHKDIFAKKICRVVDSYRAIGTPEAFENEQYLLNAYTFAEGSKGQKLITAKSNSMSAPKTDEKSQHLQQFVNSFDFSEKKPRLLGGKMGF